MTRIIATYRLPREHGKPSITLSLTQCGDRYVMTGGKYGPHEVTGDHRRIAAHWAGYCSASRGRAVKPASLRFPQEAN